MCVSLLLHPSQVLEPPLPSGERIPELFARQKPTLLLMYLAAPLLMSIPGLDFCGPVHRGVAIDTVSDILKRKHRNFMTAYAPGTLTLTPNPLTITLTLILTPTLTLNLTLTTPILTLTLTPPNPR